MPTARLVTIGISHFCEKARWALDRKQIPYREERHLQFVHIVASKRAGGSGTTPVLVTTDKQVLSESADIVRWTDPELYPDDEVAAFEAGLDAEFGPDGRLWLYHGTLPVVRKMGKYVLEGVPAWERAAFYAGGPLVGFGLRRFLGIDDATAVEAHERVVKVFDDVGERLADGRSFLFGDAFSAADLTFAALAAPMLVPAGYGCPLPPLDLMPEPMRAEVVRLRATPAGQFADRLYAEERRPAE
jgi:glutathione S-transferase